MRVRNENNGLSVHAVAGTYVVLLGIDLDESRTPGLLGFGIQRSQNDGPFRWLAGSRIFAHAAADTQPGSRVATNKHPIQDFLWSDFTTSPGVRYKYRIVSFYGKPDKLKEGDSVTVEVTTENPEGGDHDVYFNRGAAASQQYAREFGNKSPSEVGQPAWDWLSRGLFESIRDFIKQANGKKFGLRVAAYEFTYKPVLDLLREAHRSGADVQIVYHAREVDSEERDKNGNLKLDKSGNPILTQAGLNRKIVAAARIKEICIERQAKTKSDISHNKFIVLLENGKPVQVLTGSTNFSEGGIFGHSNVVHTVQDKKVAQTFLNYWKLLAGDPEKKVLRPKLEKMCSIPDELPDPGTAAIFSPRGDNSALSYYQRLAATAKHGLFMTFAFGMNELFQDVYRSSAAPVRYALMEKMVLARRDPEDTERERQKIIELRKLPENVFAIGAFIPTNMFDIWIKEKLSGLNVNVRYVHTKYMIIDPLSDDPIVVSGSANFSDNSCTNNDENMLIVRGNARVADIYLGEYMRLHRHYAFREWAAAHPEQADEPEHEFLDEKDQWWRGFYRDGSPQSNRRQFFSGAESATRTTRAATHRGGA